MATIRSIATKSPVHASLVENIQTMQRELGNLADHVNREDWGMVKAISSYLGNYTQSINRDATRLLLHSSGGK